MKFITKTCYENMFIINCKVLCTFLVFLLTINGSSSSKKEQLYQTNLPPCKACKVFVESFKKGMERTERGKFEGGDAAWEEEKLGSYAKSEIRLIEIQEKLCSDVEEGRDQCYLTNEQHDAEIEEWWLKKQDEKPDLYEYFCIEKIEACCPEGHFGTTCSECPGYPDNICSTNGRCKGSGTRKGNGKCSCDPGYTGEMCDSCAANYYESYRDEKKLMCSKCHIACKGGCTKAGARGCRECANGWMTDHVKGCMDINECAAPTAACSPLQFCVNTDGSYKCLDCDRSCLGCTGDGPDMCVRCASGFVLRNNMCVDSSEEDRKNFIYLTRYLTYFGLCLATCIIFQRSVALAAVIGLAVGIYISVSEYILNSPPVPNTTDFAERLMKTAN